MGGSFGSAAEVRVVCLIVFVALAGCERGSSSAPEPAAFVAPLPKAKAKALEVLEPPRVEAPRAPVIRLEAGAEIEVPAGTLEIGSPTGHPYRDASREADAIAVEVPAFSIDVLPYPNDPKQSFRSAVDRREAARLCEKEGKRLCHELEWERACKGDTNAELPHYAGALDIEACKRDPALCVTPFGVLTMGVTAREWTANDVTRGLGDSLRSAVVRGSADDENVYAHRCAARDAATPDSKSTTLLFRCCRGEPPDLAYPEEPAREPFRAEGALGALTAQDVLRKLPTLASRAERFRPATKRAIDESLRVAGSSQSRMAPWLAAEAALAWSPIHGEDVVIISGDTPEGALMVAAHRLGDGSLSLIGSFETRGEHNAIVLAYKPDTPREVLFSSCWGCGGEGGALVLGEDARIVIAPR